MKLKSYFADTIEEAISLARREMGPEAMLVNSKRSNAEARHLGAYEVVCAAEVEAQIAERDRGRGPLGSTAAPIDRQLRRPPRSEEHTSELQSRQYRMPS